MAIAQTDRKTSFPRQWIFAWVIFAAFLLDSIYLTFVKSTNRDVFFRSAGEPDASQGDPERAPLLPESREPTATS